ncbi:phospholipase D family protein [Solilutibacter silvestris]|uniref:PLD-like domain n=1 Tax=Solilutibacter silvestris TaxID=1645665 RepID=A0A2K1Q1A0_9GAMM|nr:phospholipase D family protein [Lysobacter silvestris]PNS08819.1 PLD-like domain [Lysobacter silvestris]
MMFRSIRNTALCLLALAAGGCTTLSASDHAHAEAIAIAARSDAIDCQRADRCADPSVFDNATPRSGNRTLLLDDGQDALLARMHMIRSARQRIDLQTYIYKEDDVGRMILRELVGAARRGVQVRVLIDQLSAMESPDTLAALSGIHRNFQLRIYSPLFNLGRPNYADYVLASVVRFRQLNQRMHTKALVVDGQVGVTGGRNFSDEYYDWSQTYNFLDRDVLVSGPTAKAMQDNFDAFWVAPQSVPVEQLNDVARILLARGVPALSDKRYEVPERVQAMQNLSSDTTLLRTRLGDELMPVAEVQFVADPPGKHDVNESDRAANAPASVVLRDVVDAAKHEVVMQTPYLVLSHGAQRLFQSLHRRPDAPRVIVSTSSLAGIDNALTYAMAYKYRRRYIQRFGFEMYELKPFPQDVPMRVDEYEADDDDGSTVTADGHRHHPLPANTEDASRRGVLLYRLNRQQPRSDLPRVGLHAKSIVVDRSVAVVGTHNFDPRGVNYNTESALVIRDPAFAALVADSIQRETLPANAWVIAPREPGIAEVDDAIVRASERLPLFDLWPSRYATAFEFRAGPECPKPLPFRDPGFYRCYRSVGDFPGVPLLGVKWWMTRVVTAFGAGMTPFL